MAGSRKGAETRAASIAGSCSAGWGLGLGWQAAGQAAAAVTKGVHHNNSKGRCLTSSSTLSRLFSNCNTINQMSTC